jgi:rhodanese-related sulfurtransferase
MQNILLFIQQHTMLVAGGVGVLLLLMIIEFVRLKRGNAQLSPAEATNLINHRDAVVIDIRHADVFEKGHIVDSVSIPFKDLKDKNKKLEKYKSQPLIIVCTTGNESPQAAEYLTKNGYSAFVMAGGIRAWQMADMPLVKG